ncbi:MAG: hypothetical protein OHK0029_01170 [Armatimonadaceae bacterium]
MSQWLPRIRQAGFDGVELWENHFRKVSPDDQQALISSNFCRLFNTYAPFERSLTAQHDREAAALAIRKLRCRGCKFNVGADPESTPEYCQMANDWLRSLPQECKALCECHPGTVLETPEAAAKAFAGWSNRFEAIVHPFAIPPETLARWMQLLGPKITHVHVQMRDADGVFQRLDREPQKVKEALRILANSGFSGSFALEFTEGTRTENDTSEFLWTNALADLAFLKEHYPS